MAYPYTVGKIRASDLNADFAFVRSSRARKTADQSVTGSTTPVNDAELSLPVEAGAVYELSATLFCLSAANAAGDIVVAYTFPAGGLLSIGGIGPHNSLASGSSVVAETYALLNQSSPSGNMPYGCSTSVTTVTQSGVLVMPGTAGTLQLQFAQLTANANASTLKAGSLLRLQRVA